MSGRLVANMPRMEVEYYKTLAAGNTVDSEVKAVSTDAAKQAALRKLLEGVASEAVTSNYEQLAALGWSRQ
ncbi:hypothetical protein LP415_02040 [Polaromonas sp. P1(28)-8]|nr:hypothetical protein LP415_02040 [Polaromonas sp. P1(28)-8]